MAVDVARERAYQTHFLDRASWGALFAGFFVGMGVLFLLLSLGAAVGFTTVDPRDADSWRSAGVVVGIWGGISAIVASFGSAWVAGRLSQSADRGGGMLHGLVLWGLTWAVLLWAGASLVTGAVGTAAGAAGSAMQAAGNAAGAAAGQVTREDAESAAQRAKEQASGTLGQARQQLDQNKEAVGDAAASGGKKGAWGAFLAALFTMIASAAGGATGAPHRVRGVVEDTTATRPLAPQRT